MQIPFNKPYITGKEEIYIKEALSNCKISGDGEFSKKCHHFFETVFGFKKVLLTTSCTDALELAAILLDIKHGDEVIAPSYTFVSSVNPFVLRGAKIIFADSSSENPNMDVTTIEALITPKTKVILAVHYAGIACDMDSIMDLAAKYSLFVVEDAAQAISSYYNNKPLGGIGHLAAFSFHETKNIISGEGGILVINDEQFIKRAEIIREKGTNRSAFFRGEVDKYSWVDVGSSFLPSDIIAAFLYAQLQDIDAIQSRRINNWNLYYSLLEPLKEKGLLMLPEIPPYATNNGHIFYLVCKSLEQRQSVAAQLKRDNIHAVFHYSSLHKSPYYKGKHDKRELPRSDHYSNCLLRLPLYFELRDMDIVRISKHITTALTN